MCYNTVTTVIDGRNTVMKNKDNEPEMPKVCAFCDKAQGLTDTEHMLCSKKGIVACGYSCRKFRYDPLKRIPRAPKLTHLDIAEIEDSGDTEPEEKVSGEAAGEEKAAVEASAVNEENSDTSAEEVPAKSGDDTETEVKSEVKSEDNTVEKEESVPEQV